MDLGSSTTRFELTSCLRSSLPTMPVPPMTATESCVLERASAACAARNAFVQSCASTTMAIWRSLDPCAMARMLMPALAMALVKVAPVPGRKAMPSPTIATTEWPRSTKMPAIRPRESSFSNEASRNFCAFAASPSLTAKQMDESDDACVTITTCTPARSSVPKSLDVRSGTELVPVPSMLSNATLSTEVTPRIGDSPSPKITGQTALRLSLRAEAASSDQRCFESPREQARPWMTVPGCDGLKMLRT
mmetsp:Transcript_34493/g.75794  ORF Transcript_34493/g.75794 Transcript_34493/m.75794 type:complete len:248 (+) Transcript_34493:1149-1892(+)